ncbi:MAG: tRNA (N6-isopentenyl adenosine(37)-C2)-methylthiotransferase MiaB [Pseudomonadota bacterium]|nr:tRNA (N6-isopentenyl adenosine(37)-C2)-methylthiotransferase MiaB [Pseudomonadota bacterium]
MDNIENFGVYISTYGCQMNVNDTERMYSLLEMMNYSEVKEPKEADLIIINSCSVREKPVHKVHSEVGRYKKLKEHNPKLRIGVSGCVAQQEKAKLLADIPLLDFVVGTDNIDSLPQIVRDLNSNISKAPKINVTDFKHRDAYHIETLVRNPGVSTFINITKGCDNFCSFCVVPFTRGRERSRPLKMLLQDISVLTKRGVKETTLLGQNVNSYESDCGANFATLLERVCLETDLQRVRYTTSHPKDFNQELVDVMQRHSKKLGAYVHLPAQSGSTEILKNMNRGYTREEYLEKISMIRKALPDVSFSTDLIIGFPGETEEQFQETVSLLGEVGYETIFAFKYSPRPFTKAARFENQVDEEVKTRRLNELFKRHKEIAEKIAERYMGRVLEVLVEEHDCQSNTVSGRSLHNKLVHFNGSKDLVGQLVNVIITEAFPHNLRGELIQ